MRASVVGAGSFGTAVALLLVRAGARTTLLCRSAEQAAELSERGENERYLPGVPLPKELKVRVFGGHPDQFHRADLVFLAVPSKGLAEALAGLEQQGVARSAGVVSLAKGLVPPQGTPPTVALEAVFGPDRVACIGGPAHAREMATAGAGLVCASHSEKLAHRCAGVFQRAGVVCEVSDDPVGVELAGCAKNAAAVAVGATEAQGFNAAGMAASDIFSEIATLAERRGGDVRTFLGRAGTGDLVATALAPKSRNRSAGELLGQGVPGGRDPRAARPGGRGARDGAAARPRARVGRDTSAGHGRARAPHRRRAATRRLGPPRARGTARAGTLRRPPSQLVEALRRLVSPSLDSSS